MCESFIFIANSNQFLNRQANRHTKKKHNVLRGPISSKLHFYSQPIINIFYQQINRNGSCSAGSVSYEAENVSFERSDSAKIECCRSRSTVKSRYKFGVGRNPLLITKIIWSINSCKIIPILSGLKPNNKIPM